MAEYIERDRLLSQINELQELCNTEVENPDELKIFNDVYDEIFVEAANIPAADVRPERHGDWLERTDGGEGFVCSCCNSGYTLYDETPYCPHCGAKMDGKDGKDGKNDG